MRVGEIVATSLCSLLSLRMDEAPRGHRIDIIDP